MSGSLHAQWRSGPREILVQLLVRLLELLDPGNDNLRRYRAGSTPAPSRRLYLCPYDPPHTPRPVHGTPRRPEAAAPRSPEYGRHERRARRKSRTALLLALDSIDAGPLVVHGVPTPPPPPDYGRRYGSPC